MIQQIAVYEKHKNLKLAADELGIKWQTLYSRLKKAGHAVTGDKERYGSDKDRLATKAESLFKTLVPFAENQNGLKFQAKVDFVINGKKVDIKASTLKKGMKHSNIRRWAFSVKKQEFVADFLVCFAFDDDGGYKILLIPAEFIRFYQSISISENAKSKWLEYEIDPNELAPFFNELVSDKVA